MKVPEYLLTYSRAQASATSTSVPKNAQAPISKPTLSASSTAKSSTAKSHSPRNLGTACTLGCCAASAPGQRTVATSAPALGSSFCQPSKALDDISEEYQCCKKCCLANLGTPLEIGTLKVDLEEKSKSLSAKVSKLVV